LQIGPHARACDCMRVSCIEFSPGGWRVTTSKYEMRHHKKKRRKKKENNMSILYTRGVWRKFRENSIYRNCVSSGYTCLLYVRVVIGWNEKIMKKKTTFTQRNQMMKWNPKINIVIIKNFPLISWGNKIGNKKLVIGLLCN